MVVFREVYDLVKFVKLIIFNVICRVLEEGIFSFFIFNCVVKIFIKFIVLCF